MFMFWIAWPDAPLDEVIDCGEADDLAFGRCREDVAVVTLGHVLQCGRAAENTDKLFAVVERAVNLMQFVLAQGAASGHSTPSKGCRGRTGRHAAGKVSPRAIHHRRDDLLHFGHVSVRADAVWEQIFVHVGVMKEVRRFLPPPVTPVTELTMMPLVSIRPFFKSGAIASNAPVG